ncbi:MAG: ABC transmembrane type-1 domain-containing protein [Oscillospiraceae bacterium]|jgi:spermidine/putrescine transport system permease protein
MIRKSGIKQSLKKHARRIFIALFYLFLYLPIFIIILFSFNTSKMNILFHGFTLKWYSVMIHNYTLLSALKNTLIVAFYSTLLSTVIGTIAAVGMYRYKFHGKNIIDMLLYVPVVIPEIVLGISLLSMFSLCRIPLGLISIIIAHVTFCIPYVVFTVRARLAGFDKSVEEAAMDLGANRRQVFFRVTIPMISPGIISGAALAFTLSIDDIIISFFTTGAKSITFPLKAIELVKIGITPDVYALSTIILLVIFIVTLISQIASYRHRQRNGEE